jgi:hypothetical protein
MGMKTAMHLRSIYIAFAGGTLLIAGEVKLLMVLLSEHAILERFDPVFGLPRYFVLTITGLFEMVIALHCLLSLVSVETKLALIAWLSTLFAVYRLGMLGTGWLEHCQCFGPLPEVLGLSAKAADQLSFALLLMLLVGSYGFLGWMRLNKSVPVE